MKEFFQYKFGFVNIDDANVYFTNSGNWSHTKGLKEKGLQPQKKSRQGGISSFLGLAIILAILAFVYGMESGKISLVLVVIIPAGIYSAYKYLRTELGETFVLPKSKIIHIDTLDGFMYISFTNGLNEKDEYVIEGAEAKGFALFKDLNEQVSKVKENPA